MASIANLLVSLSANFGSATRSFEDLGEAAEKTGNQLHDSGEEAGGAGEKFDEFHEHIQDLAKELLKLGAEILEVASIFEILKESAEVSAEIESTTVALEAFTHSAEAANEVIEHMEELAGSEALAFPEILPAAQHMMALGFSAEQVEKAMAAAGNASWALGQPLESLSQRMGMIAMSGMVSARYLRTMGINAEDLARVMGVSASQVTAAFRAMDEDSRLEALTQAMQKFGDLGAKEAETVSGKWVELKNTWHEVFATIGDDLKEVSLFLERFGTTAGNFLKDALSNNPNIDALKNLIEAVKSGKSYEDVSASRKPKPIFAIPEGETGVTGGNQLKLNAAKALAPELAKINAGPELARISAAEQANSATAALNRERVTNAINAAHEIRQAQIDAMHDPDSRARASAAEAVNVAKQKADRIGEIDKAEAAQKIKLLQSRVAPEIAGKYQAGAQGVDPAKQAAERQEIEIKSAAEVAKVRTDLADKEEKLKAGVTTAVGKSLAEESKLTVEWATKSQDTFIKFFDEVTKGVDKANSAVLQLGENLSETGGKVIDTQQKQGLGGKEQANTAAKLQAERSYGEQIIHTLADQIANIRQLGELDAQRDDLKAEDLRKQISLLDAETDQAKIADLNLQLQQAQNDAANKRFETETKILGIIQQQSLAHQMSQTLQDVPGALGGAIAGGIANQGKGGMDIGKEITNALRNIGKTLMSEVFTKVINMGLQEIAHMIGLTVSNVSLQTAILGQTAATTANTAALSGSTVKTIASFAQQLAKMLGLTTASASQTAATTAQTAATTANTAAVTTATSASSAQMGANLPSSADLAARDASRLPNGLVNNTGQAIDGIPSLTESAQPLTESFKNLESSSGNLTDQFGSLGDSLFGSGSFSTGGNGFISGLTGLLGLVGFAGGGDVDGSRPVIVGEEGPELFMPKNPGAIIPNKQLVAGGHYTSVSSSNESANHFHGDIHVHGSKNPEQFARDLPGYLKKRFPGFSPNSSLA